MVTPHTSTGMVDDEDWLEAPNVVDSQGGSGDPIVEQEDQRLVSRYNDVSVLLVPTHLDLTM
jgi:hypothetical protein